VLTTRKPVAPTLGISVYPEFLYDASGDCVAAEVGPLEASGRRELVFTVEPVTPVNGGSTTLLGVPLPPFVTIAIQPKRLRGHCTPSTGSVALDFDALFTATIFGYTFPALAVTAPLTTGRSVGAQRRGSGVPWNSATGECTLVAVARVPPTGNPLLDGFLMLPADALAVLPATLEFLSPEELADRQKAGVVGTRPPNEERAAQAARAWTAAATAAAVAVTYAVSS
jgi:hypothetical protein